MTGAKVSRETTAVATINTSQMQALHALLRDHGITGDGAVHDWIGAWLVEHDAEPVESRRDLSTVFAAKMIRDLETADVVTAASMNARTLRALRAPFTDDEIGKLPKSTCKDCSDNRGTCQRHPEKFRCQTCGNYHSDSSMHIDYVGHADVTARLLEADPTWTWEPAHKDPATGEPSVFASIDRDGNLWIRLTVGGVTRLGVGDGKNMKERIGDALRNAAMRFGVALDLWAKGDRDWAKAEKVGGDFHPDSATSPPQQVDAGSNPKPGPDRRLYTDDAHQQETTKQLLSDLEGLATAQGIDLAAITAKWRQTNGGIPVEDLPKIHPEPIAELFDGINSYLTKQREEAAAK